ncbi:hypothetical protein [Paenibacillus montanisoli]|uniref:Alpha-galactosidase n=1 Tax=Paenibacillus montanisoli TaxID=2081970 RepID=A0A328U0Q0_9BACL|nr:hypothetical protein [Paenibacillus montanisoli]RAP73556.1 hypothetical protein DL346_25080 [Paenibacillus montanisoli]
MTTTIQQHSLFRFEERASFGISAVNPFQEERAFRFEGNDPKLYLGDGSIVRHISDFAWVGRESKDGGEAVVFRLQDEQFALRLTWIYRVEEHKASWRLELVNEGESEVALRHIDLFDAVADAPVRQFEQRIRLDLGEADWMEEKDVNHATGYPVNIGNRLFLGVDWPVADVLTDGGRITCRQYCADTLAPGQTFRSRTVTVGACEEGRMSERFLAHLKDLRGRETRRASFYFSWLTHSWEGMTDRELKVNLDFFERAKSAFGIHFDIYAVDAGVIETNHYGYERYRLMHEKLLPNGLKPHADRVKDMGMEFGIWIGPNEFGEKGSRVE